MQDKIRIEDTLDVLAQHHPDYDEDFVQKAYIFSAQQHKDQVRSSGEPYLVHPLMVANILANMGLDPVTVVVGLLHDVIEDTLTKKEDIERLFGYEVAHCVEGLSKISQITYKSREEKQAQNFLKMLIHMVDDIRVILVKLADRLHNMSTLEHLTREKQIRIALETKEIYVPFAHRLGMGKIKQDLEDLCFRYLEPEKYAEIIEDVNSEIPINKDAIQ